MVFNSNVFLFAFFPVVFAAFWAARTKAQRYALLAIAGYVFYGYWDWRYCVLLLFSSLVSFFAALGITGSTNPRRRKAILVSAISVDLSLLGFFKYYDFFAQSLASLAPGVAPPLLHVVLPIGISFYTFHTISYVVDVYAGRVRATRNLPEYLTYVNLFSQLVAGPIVRFRQIEADLEAIDGPPREDWMAKGVGFFVIGLVKKVVIADHLASIVDPMLAHGPPGTFVAAWVAALGYTAQLYFDFSGYSDMAVGLGYLFGLRIPQNFNAPYHAAGIGDFWRRWHISLSSWLRDYLYLPLGGNRGGTLRTYRNLMIVMLLGGLWHGANWTFVVWGGYHGLMLIVDRVAQPVFSRLPRIVYQLQTFLLALLGWVFFRSPTLGFAVRWFKALATYTAGGIPDASRAATWLLIALLLIAFAPETWDLKLGTRRRWAVAYAFAFALAYLFMNGNPTVFLYYQF